MFTLNSYPELALYFYQSGNYIDEMLYFRHHRHYILLAKIVQIIIITF